MCSTEVAVAAAAADSDTVLSIFVEASLACGTPFHKTLDGRHHDGLQWPRGGQWANETLRLIILLKRSD